jgi:hypothetical protein
MREWELALKRRLTPGEQEYLDLARGDQFPDSDSQVALRALAIPPSLGRLGPTADTELISSSARRNVCRSRVDGPETRQTCQCGADRKLRSYRPRLGPTHICRGPETVSQSHLGRMTAATIDYWDFMVFSFAVFFEVCGHVFSSTIRRICSNRLAA